MRATFKPQKMDTQKPHMLALVDYTADWHFYGYMDDGPYAGQEIFRMDHDDPRYQETNGSWVPAEDLVVV